MELETTKPNFNGKWILKESENFDAFLEATGAPQVIRKTFKKIKPDTKIKQEEDKFLIKIMIGPIPRKEEFTINEEFQQKQIDGTRTTAKPEWVGNKLVITYNSVKKDGTEETQIIKRELIDDGETLLTTMFAKDVVAKRTFKRNS